MKKLVALVLFFLFAVSTVSYAVEIPQVKVNGDFRFRYTLNQAAGANDSFTVPRARIKISGNVTEDLSLVIQPDFAGLSAGLNVAFADVYADLKCHSFLEKTIRFGQFEVPFSFKSGGYKTIIYPSHYNVIVPDRDFGFGMLGDIGPAGYFVSLTNGNRFGADNNNSKDLAARVILDTAVGELGLSGYYGHVGFAETEQSDVGAFFKTNILRADLFAEYVGGDNRFGAKMSNAYLQLSKRMDKFEPLIQYEIYDPNTDTANNAVNTLTIGLNKYVSENGSRFMINYNIIEEETFKVDNNTLVFQLRVKI
jgi:hypothetical protein